MMYLTTQNFAQRIGLMACDNMVWNLPRTHISFLVESQQQSSFFTSLLYILSSFSGTETDWLQRYWSHILLVMVFSTYMQSHINV